MATTASFIAGKLSVFGDSIDNAIAASRDADAAARLCGQAA